MDVGLGQIYFQSLIILHSSVVGIPFNILYTILSGYSYNLLTKMEYLLHKIEWFCPFSVEMVESRSSCLFCLPIFPYTIHPSAHTLPLFPEIGEFTYQIWILPLYVCIFDLHKEITELWKLVSRTRVALAETLLLPIQFTWHTYLHIQRKAGRFRFLSKIHIRKWR